MGGTRISKVEKISAQPITSLSAAIALALYGIPAATLAQQQPTASSAGSLGEITVTATRREQKLEEVPYSLTVISGEQIAKTGVTDIASLASQVPGLSLYDFGARLTAGTTPIIRGLNGTGESAERPFRSFEQSPVGMYIGNSPISGYFQLDDIQRIEVLRGPQGTLYGAGALGGALRIMPNAPEMGVYSGRIDASVGSLAHSSGTPFTAGGTLNLPLGDTLAFRVSGKYAYEPGFVDVYGIVQRDGSPLYGHPVLADPSDPVNSPAIYSGKRDWNFQKTFTGRASLAWKPIERFSAELAFIYSNLEGVGGPETNSTFKGGAYYIDPRITFPSGGEYQDFASFRQPYWRRTSLASLDLSFDAGFATLSSTTSYFKTVGLTQDEGTYNVAGYPGYGLYYAGTPLNPRFVYGQEFTDNEHAFTEEVRLVSKAGPDKSIDYVIGAFYEKQETGGNWYTTTPGSFERSVAQGCTAPYFYGASFPNCLLTIGPDDVPFLQFDKQDFQDKSVFGELTWHFVQHGQVTFGVRHFKQEFTDAQSYQDFTFPVYIPATPHDAPASKTTWKINPSYEYVDHQFVYATWSQGFRRGGANSVPLTGIFRESPLLAQYVPDSVNNYEIGLKGRSPAGLSYTVAAFDMRWDKPQISASLPSGNLAVYNGNTAESKGIELEMSGPLFVPGFTFTAGGAYTDAKLTSSFSLPANDGTASGNIVDGEITGTAGQRLPGSPRISAAATVTYEHPFPSGWDVSASLNGTYRGDVPLFLSQAQAAFRSPPIGLFNLSATVSRGSWKVGGYVTNLADRRVPLVPAVPRPILLDADLVSHELINPPRELGVRLGYKF